MKYIRLYEVEANVERIIHLTKLYDYLVDKGIEDINFHENVPQITNDITHMPGYPITFSITLSRDVYIRTIQITYLTPDQTNVMTTVFRYNDFEEVLDFLKDLELQYSANKYNL